MEGFKNTSKKIGIDMKFETTVADLIVENGTIKGVKIKEAKYQ